MEKEKALELLNQNIQNKNLVKHCLAVGQAMKKLAEHFEQDAKDWEICGLLHDIDYEETKDDASKHSKVGAKMLESIGIIKEICKAVLTHNQYHNINPEGLMAKSLFCVDPLTGLIVASALVLPSKKIRALNTQNILNRFKEKAFARGANRETIKKCEYYLSLSLENFVEIVLNAMKEIANELGL